MLGFFPPSLPAAGKGFLSGWKSNIPLPVELQHESPANPILECAVGLSPVPFPADYLGQRSTALARIVGDNPTEKVDVVCAYSTFAVSEYLGHVENITDSVLDRTLFFKIKMTG